MVCNAFRASYISPNPTSPLYFLQAVSAVLVPETVYDVQSPQFGRDTFRLWSKVRKVIAWAGEVVIARSAALACVIRTAMRTVQIPCLGVDASQ